MHFASTDQIFPFIRFRIVLIEIVILNFSVIYVISDIYAEF